MLDRLTFYRRSAVALAPAVVVIAWPSLMWPTVAVSVATVAVIAVRWLRQFRRRWTYIWPTQNAIRTIAGSKHVRLRIYGEVKPRPSPAPSRLEAKLRGGYSRVEPVLRWLPDRIMRAQWALQKPLQNWLRRPDPPRIKLTMGVPLLTTEQKQSVTYAIGEKIPLGDLRASWDQVGRRVTARWHTVKRPPVHVGIADLERHFPKLADHEFFLGLDSAGQPVIISLEDDSPHIACSAGSGAGKSVLAMLIAVQVLRRGGRVVILDRKGSHRWARGLDGVTYCTKPQQMHEALIQLSDDAWGRNDTAFDAPDGWTPDDRVLVIAEELNATFSWLRRFWAGLGEKGISPAVTAFQDLLFTGRSAMHHVFAVAQMLTANTVGGGEARENFAVRALARYTANAWKMLCAGVPMPRRSRVRGRWQIVVGDESREVQVAFLTAAQARAFAGVPIRARGLDGAMTSGVTGNRPPTGNRIDPHAELISLAEAIDEGTLPWKKGAVKMRISRARDAGRPVPEPAGQHGKQKHLYRRGDLAMWAVQEQGAHIDPIREDSR